MKLSGVLWVVLFTTILVLGGVRLAKHGADMMRERYEPFGAYIESQEDKR